MGLTIDKPTLITFALFGTEALMHYNIGRNKDQSQFELVMPPPKDLAKILGVVMLVSMLNRFLVKKYT